MIGRIYKVVNSVDDMIYIGSTTRRLSMRMGNHRTNARNVNHKTSLLYKHMRKIGVAKFKIKLIKEVECDDRKALEKKEYKIISKIPIDMLLNMNTVYGKYCKEHIQNARLAKIMSNNKTGSIFRITNIVKQGGWLMDCYVFRW